ncbi:MAG TPA: serine hydrolase domain-containing protein [Jiangellaceae bacterium]
MSSPRRPLVVGTIALAASLAASPAADAVPARDVATSAIDGHPLADTEPSSTAKASADDNSSMDPEAVTADDLAFHQRTLRPGSALDAGLVPEYVDAIVPNLRRYLEPGSGRDHPSFAGAVVLVASHGMIVEHAAIGHAVRYSGWSDGEPKQLPSDSRVPMAEDTVFDLASLTKLFTATSALSLADDGLLDFDAPVADYLPEFAAGSDAKAQVTVAQLLNHTSGLPAGLALDQEDTYADRIDAVLAEPLNAPPGEQYEYSDLNLITLGKLIEAVTGDPLDVVIAERITEPLGMSDTMFNPPRRLRDRIAATTVARGRGVLRGEVHDPSAQALRGVAGHAGLFSTAPDLAVFAQMLLNGGTYDGVRVLSEAAVREIFTNENTGLGASAARGRGFQLDQRHYMGALSSPVTVGHTGFTGTSIVIDPLSESFVILLTNRVHPTAGWGRSSEYRRSPARDLARAVPVEPSIGPDAWYSGRPQQGTSSLTAPLGRATRGGRVGFRIWYDTSDPETQADEGMLLASSDGQTFEPVRLELSSDGHAWEAASIAGFSGRRWLQARAVLPDGTTHLRWTYETRLNSHNGEPDYQGRGIYLDHIRVADEAGRVFNSQYEEDAERLLPDGWYPSAN